MGISASFFETTTNSLTMKTFISLTCLSLVACSPGGGYHSRTRTAPAAPTKNIAELAIATPQLSTLLAAVKAAGLVDPLAGEGPFTVFAPTNDAFAKIRRKPSTACSLTRTPSQLCFSAMLSLVLLLRPEK